ncbi:MAG: hypothetical protein E6I38_06315 [Chloroflexi bacterium]|nr:MAG: hypothetical protein E6I38_06315 [Chloroflexota bacterium]
MHRLGFSVLLSGLLTVGSERVRAQQPDPLTPAQRAGVALARLEDGQRVRVRAKGHAITEGQVVESSASLVTLRRDRSLIAIPVQRVDSLWVRSNYAGSGALIGGAVGGAVLGGAVGAIIGVLIPKWRLQVP